MKIAILSLCCITAVLLTTTTVDAAFSLDKNECVEWHNKYRRKHQAPDIKWSESLASDAQKWADYLAASNKFEHDPNRQGQGENLYWSPGDSEQSCEHAIIKFYNEEIEYNFENPGYTYETRHFTQVVWVKSTELGVGKAEEMFGGTGTILVFRYSPSGNKRGQFAENVKPVGSAPCHGTTITHLLGIGTLSLLLQALA